MVRRSAASIPDSHAPAEKATKVRMPVSASAVGVTVTHAASIDNIAAAPVIAAVTRNGVSGSALVERPIMRATPVSNRMASYRARKLQAAAAPTTPKLETAHHVTAAWIGNSMT